MSIECGECEEDARRGHADSCSRHPRNRRATPSTATAVVPAGRMQPAPKGTRWYAYANSGDWLTLELRTLVEGGHGQLLGAGSCAAEARHVISLSGQLVWKYHRNFEFHSLETATLVGQINAGEL